MSEHWFRRYRREVINARAWWKTSPPHRKAVREKAEKMMILAYAWSTFITEVEQNE